VRRVGGGRSSPLSFSSTRRFLRGDGDPELLRDVPPVTENPNLVKKSSMVAARNDETPS
jgi:hypothetical protein